MSARTLCSLLLLAGVSLSFVLIASRHPEDANEPSTEVERIDRSVDSGQDVDRSGGYETLVTGGQLYAGTVLSVTVQKAGPRRGPGGPQEEWGSLQFRVDRTVAGPDVRELTLGYWWLEDSVDSVGTDWVCNDGPWRERPRAGQHLLLQLAGDKQVADGQIRRFGSPVCHVWRGVGGDHPLVHG